MKYAWEAAIGLVLTLLPAYPVSCGSGPGERTLPISVRLQADVDVTFCSPGPDRQERTKDDICAP